MTKNKSIDPDDLLNFIKNRRTIRKYQDKPIPKEIIDKIIEAGIWGPSVSNFFKIQPWRFVVVSEKHLIKELSEIALKRSKNVETGVDILLRSAGNIINNAAVIIIIYNSGDIEKFKNRYSELYTKFSKIIPPTELAAISASIQNMILMAEYLGIGSCWLTIPLFCEKNINRLINTDDKLTALLTLGYPAEKGKRSKRKPYSETVRYIN